MHKVWSALFTSPAPAHKEKCLAPYRPDKSPGCRIVEYGGIDWLEDFALTPKKVNNIGLFARANNLPVIGGETCKHALVWALDVFGSPKGTGLNKVAIPLPKSKPKEWKAYEGDLRKPTTDDLEQLCRIRGRQVTMDGLDLMVHHGLLWIGWHKTKYDEPRKCFAFTDSTRRSVDFRRYDGKPWWNNKKGKPVKSVGPEDYRHDWPLGIEQYARMDSLMLVEGSGDLMSAFAAVAEEGALIGVIAMLGSSNAIPVECLDYFRHKKVWIYPHKDKAGQDAATRWSSQLRTRGVDPYIFPLPGVDKHGGDLGDYMKLDHSLRGLCCPH